MTINGFATLEGTERYRERFKDSAAAGHFREAQELLLSSLGIGTYLGNADDETDIVVGLFGCLTCTNTFVHGSIDRKSVV